MSTQHWATPIDNTSDTGFRAWGSELNGYLAAAGLVQASDTGQINWSTATVPGGGSDSGYEIWHMNDAMQSTAPSFFKITYGTNGSNGGSLKFQHGSATDGAGTLSGTTLTAAHPATYAGAVAGNTSTSFDSYICVNDGFFGLYWKTTPASGTPSGNDGCFLYCRTSDATGAATAEGAHITWGWGNSGYSVAHQPMRYASPATLFTLIGGAFHACAIFCNQASSADDSGNGQVYVHYTITPSVRPLHGQCTVYAADLSQGTTFTAILVGSTARTFIALRPGVSCEYTSNSGAFGLGMLWE